jgi:hypothetical protein
MSLLFNLLSLYGGKMNKERANSLRLVFKKHFLSRLEGRWSRRVFFSGFIMVLPMLLGLVACGGGAIQSDSSLENSAQESAAAQQPTDTLTPTSPPPTETPLPPTEVPASPTPLPPAATATDVPASPTAIPPAATATDVPTTEEQATQGDDIIGEWVYGGGLSANFSDSGRFTFTQNNGVFSSGEFRFENDQLVLDSPACIILGVEDFSSEPCVATYSTFLVMAGDEVVGIRFVPIEDEDDERRADLRKGVWTPAEE